MCTSCVASRIEGRDVEARQDRLRSALMRAADGLRASEAAVRLLVAHAEWLPRLADASFVAMSADRADGPVYAEVRWAEAVAALDSGRLPASRSAARVLRVAASLADGVPIDLAEAVSGLDRSNLGLVLAALSHANGSHQDKLPIAEPPDDDAEPSVDVASPSQYTGPLYPWPSARPPRWLAEQAADAPSAAVAPGGPDMSSHHRRQTTPVQG